MKKELKTWKFIINLNYEAGLIFATCIRPCALFFSAPDIDTLNDLIDRGLISYYNEKIKTSVIIEKKLSRDKSSFEVIIKEQGR